MSEFPLLSVTGLGKRYLDRRSRGRDVTHVDAVRELSFSMQTGDSLAIVGESGSGKTTTARMILGLEEPTAGSIAFLGRALSRRPSPAERRERARGIQIVFQDPYLSLDPRQSARRVVDEVIKFHFGLTQSESEKRTTELLHSVGLGEAEWESRPAKLSGGQRQRVAIARALAAQPTLLVLDEAVSALDVSVQAQILNLLQRLRRDSSISYLFITHNLAVVRQVCDDVLVMYRGTDVERGPVDEVLSQPSHPYTQKLIASVPSPESTWSTSPTVGDDPASGCPYRTRCPHSMDACEAEPALVSVSDTHQSRCWLHSPAESHATGGRS